MFGESTLHGGAASSDSDDSRSDVLSKAPGNNRDPAHPWQDGNSSREEGTASRSSCNEMAEYSRVVTRDAADSLSTLSVCDAVASHRMQCATCSHSVNLCPNVSRITTVVVRGWGWGVIYLHQLPAESVASA